MQRTVGKSGWGARSPVSLVGCAGIAASISLFVGVGLLGVLPDDDDGGVRLAAYVADHRGALIAASVVIAASSILNIAFWVLLRGWLLGGAGRHAGADVGVAGAVMAFTMFAAGAAALQTAGYVAGRQGGLAGVDATVLLMVFTAATNLSGAAAAVLGIGFGSALLQREGVPRWWGQSLVVVGVAQVTALVSVAPSGPFSATGKLPYLGPALYALWLIAVPVALLRRSARDLGA